MTEALLAVVIMVLAVSLFLSQLNRQNWKWRAELLNSIRQDGIDALARRDEQIGRLKKELDETRIEVQAALEKYENEQNRTINLVDGLLEAVDSWKK